MRGTIVPAKQRVVPKGGADDWKLKEGQRTLRKPGAYLLTDASLR
eukprot:CAMPEP_0185784462 /NCGR_PEP_ID=MMETSP1174-20130828/123250_1 /TAXON_ID=35687 /ORGANISM="Dictyocha speculum, Strain CCMP1381" /LENGTH=44 /DNA_ID= /DNA_START= /DNA_END= /DNA_ORIENTATION=